MRKTGGLVKNGFKAVTDLNLLKILQSEIQHELSSSPPPRHHSPQASGLGDFVVEWDSAETNDVLLRRKLDSGEEVAVSARLSAFDRFICCPSEMKICVKKPGLNALLYFHCQFMVNQDAPTSSSWFRILRCHYLHSPSSISPRLYTPKLDSELRSALQEYLVAKGIGQEFTSFLWHYLCKKEQGQYVNWLHKLESFVV